MPKVVRNGRRRTTRSKPPASTCHRSSLTTARGSYLPESHDLQGGGRKPRTAEQLVANDVNAKVELHILCPTCKEIVSRSDILNGREWMIESRLPPSGSKERSEQFVHYPTKEEMQASVHSGCHLCTLLWYTKGDAEIEMSEESGNEAKPIPYGPVPFTKCELQVHQAENMSESCERGKSAQLAANVSATSPATIVQINCSVSAYTPKLDYINISVEFNSHLGSRVETTESRRLSVKPFPRDRKDEPGLDRDDPIDNDHDAQISISTASDASFSLAMHWIDRCRKNHPLCRKALNSSASLPARLIDVRLSSRRSSPQLRITEEMRQRPKYLALSHCWGGADILRLNEKSLKCFAKAIPEGKLPLTFRDAITITRRLGYRYLWIDSLCIIQDSARDWERESSIMGDIYRGSDCTISALGAKDSHGGCFTTRNPLRFRPCRLTGEANKEALVARGATLKYSRQGHLFTRAWVFQERMLSPRTLHYGSKAISWECIECDATEPFPKGDTWDWNKDKQYCRPKEAFELLDLPIGDELGDLTLSNGFNMFHYIWSGIIQKYTYCSLTRPDDKLVAINGVIRKIEQRTEMTNVAGLWRPYLLPELLWNTSNPKQFKLDLFRPELYRAPTWSWASIDSEVNNSCPDLVRGRHENILGFPICMSYNLEWKADVVEVEVTTKPNGRVTDGYLRIRGPMQKIEWMGNGSLIGDFQSSRQARSASDRWLSDFLGWTAKELWGLLIARGTGSPNASAGIIDVGLALEPVEGQNNVFRRFGYFEQCYWANETYPIFAGEKGTENRMIIIV
jgi:hypothetical protein